jgi:SNF2 family DNA or RNA helicase
MIHINIAKSKQCNGDYALFITFPYNNKIVDTIRSFPTRYWDKNNKVWELPLNKLGDFTSSLSEFDFEITGVNVQSKPIVCTKPENFEFKTTPFEHQIEGFNYGLTHDRWLLGDEQGLGKTKQVIDIAVAKKLQYGYKHCLIICGVNGLKWNWRAEIQVHSNETGWILGQRFKKSGQMYIGSNKDKLEDVNSLDSISSYFIITNVESLRDKDIVSGIAESLRSGAISMLALDESHRCANPGSQQSKGLLSLKSDTMIAMTGTPLMNRPTDLYMPLKWLGYERHSFYAFRNHYCQMGGYGGYEVIGYKNLDELQTQLASIMLRRLKSEVLDLPEKLYIDEYVEMSPKQAQIYKEVTMETKANIDKIKSAPNPLSELIRMRQATGYTGILSSTIKESAKLDRMEELVDEAVDNNQKVVIFSNWTQVTLPAYNRLATKHRGTYITGEVDSEQRQSAIDKFQTDKNCKFVVGSIGAMGTGITLTEGTVVIFLDHPWTRGAYDQAVDRCHRIGQKSNVTIYNLLCKNTIDERIWDLVNKKGALSDALVDQTITENVTDILNYLLN